MKWMEIIEVRLAAADPDSIHDMLASLEACEECRHVHSYSRLNVHSDFSVHLHHDTDRIPAAGSPLGLQLAAGLKTFGLVNHSIWIDAGAARKEK